MIVWLSIGIISTITTFYLGKKGWHALHKAVGISSGVLIYHQPDAPLSLSEMAWQQLTLNQQHLIPLSDEQLRQLQRIDDKVTAYQQHRRELNAQHIIPTLTEAHFVLQKWLEVRLPQMLASHYQVHSRIYTKEVVEDIGGIDNNRLTASRLLQEGLDNIEQRLDNLLEQMDARHLQDLRAMKQYMDEHNHNHR